MSLGLSEDDILVPMNNLAKILTAEIPSITKANAAKKANKY